MSNRVKLSIIIPVLDAEGDIKPLFRSLAAQTGVKKKTIEVILINDGSNDKTLKEVHTFSRILEDYKVLRVVNHKKRAGLAKTRLEGVKVADGQHVVFVDKKIRPDPDYLENFQNKNRNIIIGNVYTDKKRSAWDRLLSLIRKKLYFPYFNHQFDDILLDRSAYRRFKNKGGGGAMYVKRSYFLQVAETLKTGKHTNDDSLLIEGLADIEPVLKTVTARSKYLNRTGYKENLLHIYNRGPKFVDYYVSPGTRYFPFIASVIFAGLLNALLIPFWPEVVYYELAGLIVSLALVSLYLSEDVADFTVCVLLLPVVSVVFVVGVIKGLIMKALRLY